MPLNVLEIIDPEHGDKLLIRHNGRAIKEWAMAVHPTIWTPLQLRADLVELAQQAMVNQEDIKDEEDA